MTHERPLLLSLARAAALLGVSRNRTIHDLIDSGALRVVVVAGRIRVPREEVERLAREGSEPAPKPRRPRRAPGPRPCISLEEELRALKF